MKRYLVMAMRKPDFPAEVAEPHRAFLAELRATGRLELSGGFGDGSGGAYLLKNVASLEEAKALAARDSLAQRDASEITVYEWDAR
ncbi:MAG: YciI family protein [Pseudoxanthomonas sp.]